MFGRIWPLSLVGCQQVISNSKSFGWTSEVVSPSVSPHTVLVPVPSSKALPSSVLQGHGRMYVLGKRHSCMAVQDDVTGSKVNLSCHPDPYSRWFKATCSQGSTPDGVS